MSGQDEHATESTHLSGRSQSVKLDPRRAVELLGVTLVGILGHS